MEKEKRQINLYQSACFYFLTKPVVADPMTVIWLADEIEASVVGLSSTKLALVSSLPDSALAPMANTRAVPEGDSETAKVLLHF